MLHEDRSRAESFGAVAQLYDRARPSYPPALVDTLLGDGARTVLDVGCGTGIAAALFAARGCQVLGVEIDPRMAAVARGKGLQVEVASFEGWEGGGRRFELLISGQAWHWIEPRAGALKAAALLTPGGRIGLFWNFAELPRSLRDRLRAIYARLAPELERHSILLSPKESRAHDTMRGIAESGAFEPSEVKQFSWHRRYETVAWLEQLRTHSDHRALAPEVLDRLLAEIGAAVEAMGGAVELPYETLLVTTRREG